jgi:hypothetical protein
VEWKSRAAVAMGQTGGGKFMFILSLIQLSNVLNNPISSHKTWKHSYDSVITLKEIIAAYIAVLAKVEPNSVHHQ